MASGRLAPDEIYDALIDDEAFAALPLRLAQAYGGRSTMIHWGDAHGAAVLACSGYFTHAELANYANHFADQDPWVAASVRAGAVNVATNLEDLVPVEQFMGTAFYNEYLRPMGDDTVRCLGIMAKNSFGQGVVAIQRGRSQHGYTDAQVGGVDALAPHLRRMLAVRGRLAGVERRLGAVRQMLDALPQAALLLRADGRVLEANAAAIRVLEKQAILHSRAGRIGAHVGEAGLLAAVARACDPICPTAGAVLLGAGGALATVSPVKDSDGAQRALLLLNTGPTAGRNAALLRTLYGLTEAEAAVAIELADGRPLATIGEQRGVSLTTIRTQLRSIADKLGVRRQAEIAAIVARALG